MICGNYDKDAVKNLVRYNQLKKVMMKRLEALQKKHKLKKSEIIMMAALLIAEEENTSTDLCKITGMNKAQTSKTLDALHRRNLVTYRTDERDRRYVHYFISEEGQTVADDLQATWEYLKERLFKGVPEEDIATYMSVTKQMHNNIYEFEEQ